MFTKNKEFKHSLLKICIISPFGTLNLPLFENVQNKEIKISKIQPPKAEIPECSKPRKPKSPNAQNLECLKLRKLKSPNAQNLEWRKIDKGSITLEKFLTEGINISSRDISLHFGMQYASGFDFDTDEEHFLNKLAAVVPEPAHVVIEQDFNQDYLICRICLLKFSEFMFVPNGHLQMCEVYWTQYQTREEK
ncbi:uncharacterized protein LOC122506030 [Leptopilina heterotoma]|uniref:uncharacterized protein LOC122506030 n=1 Tax=Leptopilina heterotoma TaxID=63436 RepID=UPI001CA91885|nr:uncharacterized protein LOC122506030 [Leptopilina heterotoma]